MWGRLCQGNSSSMRSATRVYRDWCASSSPWRTSRRWANRNVRWCRWSARRAWAPAAARPRTTTSQRTWANFWSASTATAVRTFTRPVRWLAIRLSTWPVRWRSGKAVVAQPHRLIQIPNAPPSPVFLATWKKSTLTNTLVLCVSHCVYIVNHSTAFTVCLNIIISYNVHRKRRCEPFFRPLLTDLWVSSESFPDSCLVIT